MKIFTVVEVESGVAVSARSFFDLHQAEGYSRFIASCHNLEEDDVQMFEQTVE